MIKEQCSDDNIAKTRVFGDWELPPWEVTIYKDKLLGEGSF